MTRTRSSRVTCCPTVTASSTLPSYLSTRALPAFYTVVTGDGVKAELTATSHAGLHRYTFPSGKTPLLRLDLKQGIGWDKMYDSRFTQLSPTVISGYRYISYDDIIKGGTLELVMGPKPSKWGTAKADRP